jgi:hypothetical protein
MNKLIYGFGGGEQIKLNADQINSLKVLVDDINYSNNRIANSNGSGCYYYRYESKILNPSITSTGVITQNLNKIEKGSYGFYYIKINQKGLYKLDVSIDVTTTCATSDTNINQPSGISIQVYNDKNWNQKTEFFPVMANDSKSLDFSLNIDAQAGSYYQINIVTAINTIAQTTVNIDFTDIDVSLTADASNVLTDGSIVRLNSSIPDIKCSDFLKGILNLFYAYMSDPIYNPTTNKSTIYIDSFVNFYENQSNYDNWTSLVDNSKDITIQSNSLVEGNIYAYKFSEEKDRFNNEYKLITGSNYGEKQINIDTWLNGEVKFELPFATYPTVKPEGKNFVYPIVINEESKPYKGKGMLCFYNGLRQADVNIYNCANDTNLLKNFYPFTHHIRFQDNQNNIPLFDLHFSPRQFAFDSIYVVPNLNTFEVYHKKFLNEITSIDSKLVTLYLKLTYKDINELDFAKLKMIDGVLYRLNTIKDFDSDAYGTTEVELIKFLG